MATTEEKPNYAIWAMVGVMALIGLAIYSKGGPAPAPQPNPFNPWSPSPYVNPVNPPAPYVPCPDCRTLTDKISQERFAVRRELARAQLNIQQLQTRSGIAAMRIPDWLYYQDVHGRGTKEKMTWGSEPTPAPDVLPGWTASEPEPQPEIEAAK